MTRALACLLILAAAPAMAQAPAPEGARNADWAVPVELPGVPNLHRLTDYLYRSEQPTAEGFRNLEKLGIRTVINLRYFNSDDDEAAGTALQLRRVKILTWRAGDDHVIEVMRMLRQRQEGPFLIHCQHGADRTGLMSAMYRMLEQNWTAQQALDELVDGGYGFHSLWKNIRNYVLSADVAGLRARIGSTSTLTVN